MCSPPSSFFFSSSTVLAGFFGRDAFASSQSRAIVALVISGAGPRREPCALAESLAAAVRRPSANRNSCLSHIAPVWCCRDGEAVSSCHKSLSRAKSIARLTVWHTYVCSTSICTLTRNGTGSCCPLVRSSGMSLHLLSAHELLFPACGENHDSFVQSVNTPAL